MLLDFFERVSYYVVCALSYYMCLVDMCPCGHVSLTTCVLVDTCPSRHVSLSTHVLIDTCLCWNVSVFPIYTEFKLYIVTQLVSQGTYTPQNVALSKH